MNENKDISSEIQEELNALSPKLAKMSREHGYQVPEGYFKDLSNKASQMAQDTRVERTSIIRRLITVRSVAVAASVVIIAMMVWMNNFRGEQESLASNDISVDEMIEYLEEESAFGMDEDDLLDALIAVETTLDAEEIQEIEPEETLDDEVTCEDIIDYLLEDNIDLATIIDEL